MGKLVWSLGYFCDYYNNSQYYIDQYYERSHEILPNGTKKYEIIETEVFKIMIEWLIES